ncbi:MAG: hypothetical protein VX278_02305 [Myxococcota bacterium]|nr:hypothetical protein [Myxococcota bacterium]
MKRLNPQQIFIVGHNLGYVGSYFDQVILASQMERSSNPKAKEHVQNMVANLKKVAPNFVNRLRQIELIAAEIDLPKRPLPALPPEYRDWAPKIHVDFMKRWTEDNIEGWLFGHAFSIGEIRNLLIVLMVGIDLQANFAIDYKEQLRTLLLRSKDILMRYEHTALRLEKDARFRFFYDATLDRSPKLRNVLKLNEDAVVFFAEVQKLLAEFADQERDVILSKFKAMLEN